MTEKAKTKKPKAPLLSFKYLATDFIRVTGVLPGLVWLRPKYVYENENAKKKVKGAAIAIANHSTFYDPVYISFALWYRRHRFVVKKEIYDSKAHTLLKWGRCIPIDPENAGLDSVKAVTAALKEGELVTMFPEGQVSHSQTQFNQFKSGVVLMAFKGKAPIVPIYIRDKRSFFDRMLFVFGEPIDIEKECGTMPTFSRLDEISQKLYHKEQQLEKIAEKYQ